MVENVQCPVCTLFLHAGMNLSDHLDTHPKEQVIKALVQMTISGGGGSVDAVKALLGETKTEKQESNTSFKNENDTSRSNSRLSTISNASTSASCSGNSGLNFSTSFAIQTTVLHQDRVDSSANQESLNKSSTQSYQSINNSLPQETANMSEAFQAMNFSRCQQPQLQSQSQQQQQHQQQQPQQPQRHRLKQEEKSQTHVQHSVQSQLKSAHQQQQQQQQPLALSKQSNYSNSQQQQQQHMAQVPLPPPPISSHHQSNQQHQNLQLQQTALEMSTTPIFSTNLQQPAIYSSGTQRHQQIQQQSLKIMYSGGVTLPPPPPLQLFSYQHSGPQHQKPPPAYGAAISQIRSQQNQNKNNVALTNLQLNSQQQQQQQQQQHNLILSNPPRVVTHLPQETLLTATTTSTAPNTTAFHTENTKSVGTAAQSSISVAHQQLDRAELMQASDLTQNGSTRTIDTLQKFPPSTQAHSMPFSASCTPTSSTSRQSHSPFTSLLAAPSPSSVLRYAESPVAHYLERDNGDFIVQETPKHIVECIEEEDGEFSVRERFYQSPPSVLHIHDDNDENEDDIHEEEFEKKEFNNLASSSKKINDQNKESKTDEKKVFNDEKTKNNFKLNQDRSSSSSNSNTSNINTEVQSNSCPSSISASESSTLDSVPKKSSKNTITVLSDVQLNLNEYLDLVGNIIASSKNAKRRISCTTSNPIPLVKVEKVEPADDEYEEMPIKEKSKIKINKTDSVAYEMSASTSASASTLNSSSITTFESTEPPQSSQIKANKNETEQQSSSIELPSCSTKLNENYINYEDKKSKRALEHKSTNQEYVSEHLNEPSVCSSHATSVIRMVTTISNKTTNQLVHEDQQDDGLVTTHLKNINNEDVNKTSHQIEELATTSTTTIGKKISDNMEDNQTAQDLSAPQKSDQSVIPLEEQYNSGDRNSVVKGLPPPPPLRRGPKKLVIKPKSTKTDENAKNSKFSVQNCAEEQPSGSCMVQRNSSAGEEKSLLAHSSDLVIKCEPGAYEIHCNNDSTSSAQIAVSEPQQRSKSSLSEDHFNQNQLESEMAVDYSSIKQEKECEINKSEEFSSYNSFSKDSAAEDARVLLDFANSTKRAPEYASNAPSTSFFSSNSLFSHTAVKENAEHSNSKIEVYSVSSSLESISARQSLRCEEEFIPVEELISVSCSQSAAAANGSLKGFVQKTEQILPTSHEEQPQNSFGDYPFSFFYGANNAESVSKIGHHHPRSPMYQQTPDATTTAATVASSSTLDTLDDSTSTPCGSNSLHNRFSNVQNGPTHWYQPTTLVTHSDFSAALSIDSTAVDGDVGKYLDLDACKRKSNASGVHNAPSSTSSSFAAATENSLAGGCTTDALNIRTDEKMPPKGEISEQESNCDIENSWSQPVYSEIPRKFYKTSFPGIFPHDNEWNHEEYFTVQDLSPSGNASHSNVKPNKSFEFHLPLETTAAGSFQSNGIEVDANDDCLPSTSLGSKKKRKRESGDNAHKTGAGRSKPTATITSQQFMQNEQNFAEQRQPKPSTSTAVLTSSTPALALTSQQQTRTRRKIYVCPHCNMEFAKLRDRNQHMINVHNYVRQNRRLINMQNVVLTANATAESAAVVNEAMPTAFISNEAGNAPNLDEFSTETKPNIKIKMEYELPAAQNVSQSISELNANVDPKTEFIDEKANIVDRSGNETLASNQTNSLSADKKLELMQPLALTTTSTKLTTLYRMLISFNVATLKQNQNLTEPEEKLIESSIFFCYTCRTNFTSVKLYDAHLTEHPAECFTCGKKFQRWKNFSLHLKRHLGWKEFGCNICDKRFVVRSALVEHTRMHTGHTPLKCKICGKSFKRYSNLTQHRKRHVRVHVRRKEYVCHCGEVLPSKARFLWHKETHDIKPKCCPHCCDRFIHANSLRRHIRLAHSDKFDYAEPMECPMCKQVFAKSSIKAHMATHSMDTQHDCNICNKSFSTKWNLKIHLWVHANRTAKPFKCEHCPKAFVREVDFKNHMNAHRQIKPYTCEYCGCKFIRKYNYMRHRREHHGNKKFTCDLCKKSFHRHYYLIEHRRIHTGERPFQCTICGKSSTTKTNHNKHLKIHHSRDPFTVET